MFYYVKVRKKGTPNWKTLRVDGKILVFDRYETARMQSNDPGNFVYNIVSLNCHPTHKRSPIHGKQYKIIE